jgi:glutathione S-transferase
VKLRYTPIAGYVHAVEAVIAYAGLARRVTPVPTQPFDAACDLWKDNPLGTVPTLILNDGTALYGGPVIYAFLDSLHDRPRLFGRPGSRASFEILRQLALADGVFDFFVRIGREANEPKKTHRRHVVDRNWIKVVRALDQLDDDARGWKGGRLHIGQLRAHCSISFVAKYIKLMSSMIKGLDGGFDWRRGRPRLARWHDRWATQPTFTTPLVK